MSDQKPTYVRITREGEPPASFTVYNWRPAAAAKAFIWMCDHEGKWWRRIAKRINRKGKQ